MPTIVLLLSVGAAFAAEPAVSTAAVAVELSTVSAAIPAARLEPPRPPAHTKRLLETATDVARDLADTVAYLEAGRVYFRAFSRETHTHAENQRMLEFLREYEAELNTAKKEETILNDWIRKAASLK
ncbi:MAG: hypothetical protein PHU21_06845 [Elusimicrobia bacterium]|nr:hypothetical protein [Elusimicrobiota bacterium]